MLTQKQIAKIAHEVNRAYCQYIGDNSQPKWEDAPAWQQISAMDGVSFHVLNPEASVSASHDNWHKQKLSDGWKYGAVKDSDKKEHPCMVSFEQLPKEQQVKDYLFRAVVHACLF